MTPRLNAWARSVHEYCRLNRVSVTVAEAIESCGIPPPGSSPARKLMERAKTKGFFTSEREQAGGIRGRCFVARYTAIGPAPKPLRHEAPPPRKSTGSYFDGITRAVSIFDFAEQCNSETTKPRR